MIVYYNFLCCCILIHEIPDLKVFFFHDQTFFCLCRNLFFLRDAVYDNSVEEFHKKISFIGVLFEDVRFQIPNNTVHALGKGKIKLKSLCSSAFILFNILQNVIEFFVLLTLLNIINLFLLKTLSVSQLECQDISSTSFIFSHYQKLFWKEITRIYVNIRTNICFLITKH